MAASLEWLNTLDTAGVGARAPDAASD